MKVSIGVNLRVTGYCRQGDRKYMEDCFSVAYQQTEDEKDLEYAYIGIYDGHGGADASKYAKAHLMESIIKHKNFWSNNDEEVLRAIKDGFIATHYAMWKEQENWPRTATGLPSTAGTTASIAFIRRGKIYVGHVGDSGIVLGYQPPNSTEWKAKPLTRDHKPENADEMRRIEQCGGKVIQKSGVPRVVWNRPRNGHQGPVRRSTPIDEIPFLAVARSLGDLWSYNSKNNQFIVSPNPDCSVITIDTSVHRCLIFGTDGLFNMMSPQTVVSILHQTEKHNEIAMLNSVRQSWLNPSKLLVEKALERWKSTNMRADNTTVVILMIDPPGPPKAQVLKNRQKKYPAKGMQIMRRFKETEEDTEDSSTSSDKDVEDEEKRATKEETNPTAEMETKLEPDNSIGENNPSTSSCTDSSCTVAESSSSYPLKERNFVSKSRESTSFDPRELYNGNKVQNEKENQIDTSNTEYTVENNEAASSSSQLFQNTEETSENTSTITRHNLRSSVKVNVVATVEKLEEKVQMFKRKNGENEDEPLRKSVRLDKAKNKFDASKENNLRQTTSKMSLVQKIMRSKKINRRRRVFRRVGMKQKLKLMQDTVKSSSTSNSLVRIVAKSILQKKNTNVSDTATSTDLNGKSNKAEMRSKRRSADASLMKSSAETSRKRTPSNGDLRVSAAGTSGFDGKSSVKTANSETKIDAEESSKNFPPPKHLPYGKKSNSPQRKSSRQSVLNQTPKFYKRISKGK